MNYYDEVICTVLGGPYGCLLDPAREDADREHREFIGRKLAPIYLILPRPQVPMPDEVVRYKLRPGRGSNAPAQPRTLRGLSSLAR